MVVDYRRHPCRCRRGDLLANELCRIRLSGQTTRTPVMHELEAQRADIDIMHLIFCLGKAGMAIHRRLQNYPPNVRASPQLVRAI